jgi:hypothetical protein
MDEYKNMPFKNLGANVARISEELKIYSAKLDKIPKELMLFTAFSDMRTAIREVWENIPVVEDMVKPSLRSRHWRDIAVVTQTVFDTNSFAFPLKDVIDAGVHKNRFKIQEICMNADEELAVGDNCSAVALCVCHVQELQDLWTCAF